MINGTYAVDRVVEESRCRSSTKYRFSDIGVYKIHSVALMPKIPFGEAMTMPKPINKSIFLNAEETKLSFASTIGTQNYLTTRYIGHAPLEYYGSGEYTARGREFILICKNGIPTERYRYFGTESAMRGVSRGSIDTHKLPGGGDMA